MNSLTVLTMIAIASHPHGRDSSSELEARWRREYPAAAERLERNARNFIAKGSYSFRFFDRSVLFTKELTVASSSGKDLIIRGNKSQQASKTSPSLRSVFDVSCRTPEKLFVAERQTLTSPLLLTELSPRSEEKEKVEFTYYFNIFSQSATTFHQTSLTQMMNSPAFHVSKVEEFIESDVSVVRISYTWSIGDYWTETGYVELLPHQEWAVRNAGSDGTNSVEKWRSVFSIQVGYRRVGEWGYFPDHVEFKNETDKADVYEHGILKLDEITIGNVPESIFKMSSYGLPDLDLKPVREPSTFRLTNPWFWGSVVLALTSLAILRLTRPRATQSTTD